MEEEPGLGHHWLSEPVLQDVFNEFDQAFTYHLGTCVLLGERVSRRGIRGVDGAPWPPVAAVRQGRRRHEPR